MKKLLYVLLVVLMVLGGCSSNSATPETPETIEEKGTVRFGVLKGPTGIGASYLLESNEKEETLNNYEVTVLAEATDMVASFVAGEVDIAAVPTNVAATLYNKTEGNVRLVALNTAGVLYLLEKGETVSSFEDVKGKTIYAVGQGANPEYVLNYLLAQNGLTVGQDVTVEFLDSAELTTKAASGEVELCMLPVPAVTQVLVKNPEMRIALNLTEEWDALNNGSRLTMGCVIVSATFAEEHPELVERFLTDYEVSITSVLADPVTAGEYCEKFEIVGAAAVATKAIPDCNLIFVKGDDIQKQIQGYYEVLFEADPKSIGGALPGDDFYKLP